MTTPAIKLLEGRLRAANRDLTWLMEQRDSHQAKADQYDERASDKMEEIQDLMEQRDSHQAQADQYDERASDKMEEIQDLEEAIDALSYPKERES